VSEQERENPDIWTLNLKAKKWEEGGKEERTRGEVVGTRSTFEEVGCGDARRCTRPDEGETKLKGGKEEAIKAS